jgi:hypothetical protein
VAQAVARGGSAVRKALSALHRPPKVSERLALRRFRGRRHPSLLPPQVAVLPSRLRTAPVGIASPSHRPALLHPVARHCKSSSLHPRRDHRRADTRTPISCGSSSTSATPQPGEYIKVTTTRSRERTNTCRSRAKYNHSPSIFQPNKLAASVAQLPRCGNKRLISA